jgi:hypothetical protein
MNIANISFPYPVLGLRGEEASEDADVAGEFEAPFTLDIGSKFTVGIDYALLNSPQLERLVKKGDAAFACEVTCRKTAFRSAYISKDSKQSFEIDTDLLRDQVVLSFFIVAVSEFTYADEGGWHEDYSKRSFNISRGAVLAYGGQAKVLVQREPLDGSRGSSLIAVEPGTADTGPFEVDLENDTLTIFLPKKTYLLFDSLYVNRTDYASTFHASLVVPALVEALGVMGELSQEYQDKKWYQAIDTKLSNDPTLSKTEINQQNVLTIAQQLLGFPFSEVTHALASESATEGEE